MAMTIMIVDDDRDFLELLMAVLSPEGYDVVTCSDPANVLQEARKRHPDIVVVDLLMPGLSGWQVIDQLRADSLSPQPRIIVCTASVAEATKHVDRLRQLGCSILLKPFELDDLLAVIANSSRRYRAG